MPKVAFNDASDGADDDAAVHPLPRKLYSVLDASTMQQTGCEDDRSSDDVDWPEPLDGGYGWLVVIASFFAHLIADGCGFSFGVFFVELLEVFQQTRSTTAWVGSLFVAMPSICGPLASAVTSSCGCRYTMMIGGLIAAIGYMASAFVTSIGLLCFTFGFVAGFGLSLVFVPAMVTVAFYFKKRRALATGLAVAGSGIGTFIFAPLTEFLIDTFTWRGALIIISGCMLNVIACGAVLRPLPSRRRLDSQQLIHASTSAVDTPHADTSEDADVKRSAIRRPCFMLRCKRKEASDDNLQLRDSDGNVAERRAACCNEEELIYFEPMTRSLIQFPTHLYCEWDHLAPVLLKELHRSQANPSLIHLMAARKLLDRYQVTTDEIDESDTGHQSEQLPAVDCRLTQDKSAQAEISAFDKLSESVPSCYDGENSRKMLITEKQSSDEKQFTYKLMRHLYCDKFQACCCCCSKKFKGRSQNRRPAEAAMDRRLHSGKRNRIMFKNVRTSAKHCRRSTLNSAATAASSSAEQKATSVHFIMIGRRDVFFRGSLMKQTTHFVHRTADREQLQRLASSTVVAAEDYSLSCPELYVSYNKQLGSPAMTADKQDDDGGDRKCITKYCQLSYSERNRRLKQWFRNAFDWTILKNLVFNYFCFHSLLLFLSYDIPYVYIPDQAVTYGMQESTSSFLVSIIGISSTVGQIVMGFVGDVKKVNTLYFYSAMITLAGVVTLFVPWLTNYPLLAVYCALYGVFISANFALITTILLGLVDINRLTNAIGFVSLSEGIANLIGPPLAGIAFDSIGSYDITFYLAGAIISISGVMLLAVPVVRQFEQRRLQRMLLSHCNIRQ